MPDSRSRRTRHPITRIVVMVLVAIAVFVSGALWLWNVSWWGIAVVLAIWLVFSFFLVVFVRALEDHTGEPSIWTRLYVGIFRTINWFVPWHRLPRVLGSFNLLAFRYQLRAKNLHQTLPERPESDPAWDPAYRHSRSPDGTYNDLEHPRMGAAGTRFGRNIPLDKIASVSDASNLDPSPREVSRKLLTRHQFIPAKSLNLLAAAWIQFQNHDWFNHERSATSTIDIPLAAGDPWPDGNPMKIERTEPDPTQSGTTLTFRNTSTHWWDASQVYGNTLDWQKKLRSGKDGKLTMTKDNRLPIHPDKNLAGIDLSGFVDNWWVGMSMLHTLFAREHNVICDHLKAAHPAWPDEQYYQTARLINTALMTKIHTVEWTPAILGHPALETSMNGNWWGLLGESYKLAFGRKSPSEAISGIAGSEQQHHGAAYQLTEEFTSVYRLHALIPDEYEFRSHKDHSVLPNYASVTFDDIQAENTRPFVDAVGMEDLFYSFGVAHPGALTLHNYPKALQELRTLKRGTLDLATIDILRDRERGVPRYNEFRRLMHKPPVRRFKDLTDNPDWARELEDIYRGDIERVDLMVGLYAEPLPEGFGFSDTAFRVFVLMASRRIKSDRFYTTDYTPEVYSPLGIRWVEENNMRTVLQRHFPQLTPAICRLKNAFAPWSRVR